MGGPLEFVGAGLCDHIHKPARRPSELGRGPLVHHHDLFDGVLAEGEGGPLAAPLLAEEGVVEVGAVDDEVVEDAPLAADVELVAVGALRDRDPGGEEREVEVVAAVVGEPVDHLLGEARGAGDVFRAHEVGALGLDGDALQLDRLELEREREFFADAEDEAGGGRRGELAGGARDDIVGAQREERAHESAGWRGAHGGDEAGGPVGDLDGGAGDRGRGDIQDHAPDDAGGGLRLGGDGEGGGEGGQEGGEEGEGERGQPWRDRGGPASQ